MYFEKSLYYDIMVQDCVFSFTP